MIKEIINQLEEIRNQKKPLESQLEVLATNETTLRLQLASLMETEGIKSVESDSKLMVATRTVRSNFVIRDEAEVKDYLFTNKLTGDYTRLDLVKLKKLAKTEEIPGMEKTETISVTLTEPKEEIINQETPRQFAERINKERN